MRQSPLVLQPILIIHERAWRTGRMVISHKKTEIQVEKPVPVTHYSPQPRLKPGPHMNEVTKRPIYGRAQPHMATSMTFPPYLIQQ